MALTRIQNTTGKVYNGYRPQAIIDVEHPEVLQLAGRTILGEGKESTELNLAKMNKDQLFAYAKEHEIEVNKQMKADELRATIASALSGEQAPEGKAVDLDALSDEELKALAGEMGVAIEDNDTRESIIDKLHKANE